jgi:DHA1 family tetracycline resistance protein-like MFS transporter
MLSSTQRGLAQPGSPPRALRWILLIVFLDAAGLMLLSPVIPDIVAGFDADTNRVALLVAWLATMYSSAQFFSNPLLGALSDRWGRKPILLASFGGSMLTYLAFGSAPALWVLFAGRLVDGLTGASIGTSQAYVADITTPAQRSRVMGLAGAALGLGFAVGPLVGYLLARAEFSAAVPVFVAAGLALFSVALAWHGLPESLAVERRVTTPIRLSDLNPFAPLRLAIARGPLRALVIAAFLTNFAMAGLRSHFAFFAGAHLGFTTSQVYGVMGFLGVMMVVAQGGLVRRAVDRWGDFGTLLTGMSLSAVGFFGLSTVTGTSLVYLMVAILALGVGLATPTMASLVSQRSASDKQGAMLGSAQAAGALGQVIGPAWAGLMFVHVGPGSPFSTGAALVLAAVLVVVFSKSRRG